MQKIKGKGLLFMGYTLIACIFMVYLELVIAPGYWWKAFYKLVAFLLFPYLLTGGKETHRKFISTYKMQKLRPIFYLSVAGIFLLLLGYMGIRPLIDEGVIAKELGGGPQVNITNFFPISIYITLINSFVEESFFRGFNYIFLKEHFSQKLALCFSSLAFGMYHIGIIDGWFSPLLYVLAVGGLAVIGGFFCTLDDKEGGILPGWIVHISGNIGINLIGLLILWGK